MAEIGCTISVFVAIWLSGRIQDRRAFLIINAVMIIFFPVLFLVFSASFLHSQSTLLAVTYAIAAIIALIFSIRMRIRRPSSATP